MLRKRADNVIEFDDNADLHEWLVANPKVSGFAEIYACCNFGPPRNGTRKTARTIKDVAGKAARFETFFPKWIFKSFQMTVAIGSENGAGYEGRVNNAIGTKGDGTSEKGDFEVGKLPYGVWDIFDKVIMHQGGWQLRTYPTKNGFKEISLVYLDCDGEVITPVLWDVFVKEFMAEKKESAKQAEFGLAAEDQIYPRNFKFDSIQELHIGGVILRRVGAFPLHID